MNSMRLILTDTSTDFLSKRPQDTIITATEQIQNLADDIEHRFYTRGRRSELLEELSNLPEAKDKYKQWDPLHELQALYEQLTEIQE